jgi:ABC-type multidrug transport system fused ATPase/permease subunit
MQEILRRARNALRERLAEPASTINIVARLATDYGRAYWKRYALAFSFMALGAGCTAATAYLIGTAIDQAYVSRNFYGIVVVAALSIVIFALKGLATYGQAVTLARISNQIIAANQRRMFDKLLQQDMAFFADKHSSQFGARVSYGANSASAVLNLLVTAIGRDLLTFVALGAVMVYGAPLLSLGALVVLPPAVLFLRKLIKRVRTITLAQFGGNMLVLQSLQETVQGFKIIKAFNLEHIMRAKVCAHIDEIERASNKLARVSNRGTPLMETLGGIAIAGVLLIGGYNVLVLGSAPGGFTSFITAFILAYEPAKRLARLNLELQNGLTGVRILFELLDLPVGSARSGARELEVTGGRIEFADVTFSYRPGEPVLRGMSFAAAPHSVTAFVGASGGGKSTIFNALLGLYEVQDGTVRIDGQDITTVSPQSLRRQIAYVGQDVFLFHGTIRENIALGRPGATEEDILAAARGAHAHEFIATFPDGYETKVGEQGAQLSGGQRQRIAIARALIRNAPIILLDEPTASLDSQSEYFVQAAMAELIKGRTTLMIAHRLYTIAHADMIHVVENGVIVESGRHDELIRKGQRYATFHQMRSSDQRTAEPSGGGLRAVAG